MEPINDTTKPETAYTKYQEQPHKPGLYLGLFHGRNAPAEKMEGWGFTGPTIGLSVLLDHCSQESVS